MLFLTLELIIPYETIANAAFLITLLSHAYQGDLSPVTEPSKKLFTSHISINASIENKHLKERMDVV